MNSYFDGSKIISVRRIVLLPNIMGAAKVT